MLDWSGALIPFVSGRFATLPVFFNAKIDLSTSACETVQLEPTGSASEPHYLEGQ
jgi:hypothetical protein